jgi:PAS domain S-box-containing protein
MKFPTLKLGQQAALLVLILLALESLFIGLNAWLLMDAEKESKIQEKNKEIVTQASRLLQTMYDAGDGAGKFGFSQDRSQLRRYTAARDELPRIIAWLKTECAGNELEEAQLERIEKNVDLGLQVLANIAAAGQSGGRESSVQMGFLAMRQLQPHIEELSRDQMEFLRIQRAKIATNPQTQKRHREKVKLLLLAGAALNVVVAVVLGVFFVRSITSRLETVLTNSQRLRGRKDLLPKMKGDDELAHLDATFHEMANSLRGEEELLRKSEEQLTSIIEQMPIGLFMVAKDSRVVFANPTASKLFGYEREEIIGRDLSAMFDKKIDLEDGKMVELFARKKDGQTVPVEFSIAAVSMDRMSRRLATVTDVSERFELQRMRREFVAMVSHELRTPLNAVSGFLELLPVGVFGSITEQAASEAVVADRDVHHLISLINDLLDLEKLEAGQMSLSTSTHLLEDIVDESINEIVDFANEKEIMPHFEGSEIAIAVDFDRMRQCLTKLLTFMLTYTPQNNTIAIDAHQTVGADSHNYLLIRMASESLIIPAKQVESIFERFQRIDLPHANGSTGLGLALAKTIVDQHKGQIKIESSQQKGTTVWIRLPG